MLYSNRHQESHKNRAPIHTGHRGLKIPLPDELFPVHSPLLRDSQLISFPPLIDMLKFRGFSRPIQVMIVCLL